MERRLAFMQLFRGRLAAEQLAVWPPELADALERHATSVEAGHQTPADALRMLFMAHDHYIAMQRSRALR
jgi:hypothetical protein